jgi:hypothetical protein
MALTLTSPERLGQVAPTASRQTGCIQINKDVGNATIAEMTPIIEQPAVIEKILRHLRMWAASAQRPPVACHAAANSY